METITSQKNKIEKEKMKVLGLRHQASTEETFRKKRITEIEKEIAVKLVECEKLNAELDSLNKVENEHMKTIEQLSNFEQR